MERKVRYKTKQSGEIEEYMATIPSEHVTVNDICAHFRQQGKNVGTTTVYRQLERMVAEGKVQKYIFESNAPACFEYIGESCDTEQSCFHCKCEVCGTLIHMHCDELKVIKEHLAREHGFRLDPLRTVFYGVCEDCAKKAQVTKEM